MASPRPASPTPNPLVIAQRGGPQPKSFDQARVAQQPRAEQPLAAATQALTTATAEWLSDPSANSPTVTHQHQVPTITGQAAHSLAAAHPRPLLQQTTTQPDGHTPGRPPATDHSASRTPASRMATHPSGHTSGRPPPADRSPQQNTTHPDGTHPSAHTRTATATNRSPSRTPASRTAARPGVTHSAAHPPTTRSAGHPAATFPTVVGPAINGQALPERPLAQRSTGSAPHSRPLPGGH